MRLVLRSHYSLMLFIMPISLFLLSNCGPEPVTPRSSLERPHCELITIENNHEYWQLHCPDFNHLEYQDQLYARHLYRAVAFAVVPDCSDLDLSNPDPTQVSARVASELEQAQIYASSQALSALITLTSWFKSPNQDPWPSILPTANTARQRDKIHLSATTRDRMLVVIEDSLTNALIEAIEEKGPWFLEQLSDDLGPGKVITKSNRLYAAELWSASKPSLAAMTCDSGLFSPASCVLQLGANQCLISNLVGIYTGPVFKSLASEFITESPHSQIDPDRQTELLTINLILREFAELNVVSLLPDFVQTETQIEIFRQMFALWFGTHPDFKLIEFSSTDADRQALSTHYLLELIVAGAEEALEQPADKSSLSPETLILSALIDLGAVTQTSQQNASRFSLASEPSFHQAVGKLLTKSIRVPSSDWLVTNQSPISSSSLSEIRSFLSNRITTLNLPAHRWLVFPEPRLVRNRMGGITRVDLDYPKDFKAQQQRFRTMP